VLIYGFDGTQVYPELVRDTQSHPGYHAIKVTKEGYKDYNKTVYCMKGESTNIDVAFEPSTAATPSTTEPGTTTPSAGQSQVVFGPSLSGAVIFFDGVQIAPELGKIYSVTPGYHAFKATKEGYNDYNKTVYCSEGRTTNIDVSFEPVTTAPPVTADSKSYIIFGAPVADALVYVDDELVSVEPGVPYEISHGYHGIKITKTGYEDWLKNVYIATGDTLTVSPVFEPITEPVTAPTTPTVTSKRVFVNTKPTGSKILINDGFTGLYTDAYLDLEPGIYKLTTTKSGYKPYTTYVWVGDTVLFGDAALTMARSMNMEVPS